MRIQHRKTIGAGGSREGKGDVIFPKSIPFTTLKPYTYSSYKTQQEAKETRQRWVIRRNAANSRLTAGPIKALCAAFRELQSAHGARGWEEIHGLSPTVLIPDWSPTGTAGEATAQACRTPACVVFVFSVQKQEISQPLISLDYEQRLHFLWLEPQSSRGGLNKY